MKKIFHNKKGLTLIEVLVALAILGTVFGLGYNFLNFSFRALEVGEKRTQVQQNIKGGAEVLTESVRGAFNIQIVDESDVPEELEEVFQGAIFLRDNKVQLVFKEDEDKIREQVILDGEEDNVEYDLLFRKASDEEGGELENVLSLCLTAPCVDYSIKTDVLIDNIKKDRFPIVGDGEKNAIVFHRASYDYILDIPSSEFEACACGFVSIYGSDSDPNVRLFRDFRDNVLNRNFLGKKITEYYYRFSPAITQFLMENNSLIPFIRVFLYPIAGFALLLLNLEVLLVIILLLFISKYTFYSPRTI